MRVAHWFVGSWISRIYLAVVAAVTVSVVVSESVTAADYGQPELVLLPLSMPGVLLTLPVINTMQEPWWLSLAVCVVAGALINAALINVVLRARRQPAR